MKAIFVSVVLGVLAGVESFFLTVHGILALIGGKGLGGTASEFAGFGAFSLAVVAAMAVSFSLFFLALSFSLHNYPRNGKFEIGGLIAALLLAVAVLFLPLLAASGTGDTGLLPVSPLARVTPTSSAWSAIVLALGLMLVSLSARKRRQSGGH